MEVAHRTLWCVHYASALYVSQINTRLFMLDNVFLPVKHVFIYDEGRLKHTDVRLRVTNVFTRAKRVIKNNKYFYFLCPCTVFNIDMHSLV